MKKLIALTLVSVASLSHAGLIDDFHFGAYDTGNILSPSTTLAWTPAPNVPGGNRHTAFTLEGNPQGGSSRLEVEIAPPAFAVDQQLGVKSDVKLGYGFAPGDTHAGSHSINLDMSHDPLVQLDFLGNSSPLHIDATIFMGPNHYTETVDFMPITPGTHGLLTIDFSEAGPGLHKVDAILFDFHPEPGARFAVGRIDTVPEPATIAGLAFGIVGFVARRRK